MTRIKASSLAAMKMSLQRRLRETKRQAGRVVVHLWINAKWHAAILKSGATLQDSADKAFALLMAKRRGKSRYY